VTNRGRDFNSFRNIKAHLKRIGAVVIKKLKMFMFALPWEQYRYPEDYEFHNFGSGLLALHHHAFSFSSICEVVEKKIFENWSIMGSFCPSPKAPGTMKFTIYVPLHL
jgi:hypothetical protein